MRTRRRSWVAFCASLASRVRCAARHVPRRDPSRAIPSAAPATGNDLTDPFPFNLMFATSIGPEGNVRGFLRPETAQGMFVNFRRCVRPCSRRRHRRPSHHARAQAAGLQRRPHALCCRADRLGLPQRDFAAWRSASVRSHAPTPTPPGSSLSPARAAHASVREFPLAEIEHFCNPNDKSHPKFKLVADVELPLFPRVRAAPRTPPGFAAAIRPGVPR